ncbi:MAG: NAD(P)H-binding protein [Hyphomonadaceae bacterium]|nr:NAD(P)H-binding protein [Hyphomonadaceae bacterium]MBC6412867.1 NAD(P)H-binding protein [Hyphomonadaceae bacterium]
MSTDKTLAVTGGTGFVGSHVIKTAVDAGHVVRALVRDPDRIRLNHENLQWVKGGLGACDAELVKGADCVIHIAGLVKARTLKEFMQVNAKAAGKLAHTATKFRVGRFVLVSSQAASQPHLSGYARSKKAGEDAVSLAFNGATSIIRAPAVFGPGDEATKPFFNCLRRGFLPVPGGRNWKSRRLSMVFASDLASFIVNESVSDRSPKHCVTPATLPCMTWFDLARICETALERKIKLMPLPLFTVYPVASIISLKSRLFGPGYLTRGKLREFLHNDWSTNTLIPGATAPIDAVKRTYESYL